MPDIPSGPRPGRLAFFGAGGHARELAWLAAELWGADLPLAFLVDEDAPEEKVNGIAVVRLGAYAAQFPGSPVVIAIGDSKARELCAHKCAGAGLTATSLIHPRVESSTRVSMGEGVVVCAGSVLTTNITLGRHVHVNVGCTISHDVDAGDFTTFSPGVHIAGWVTIGRRVFFGTGAIVKNGAPGRPLAIGDDAIVGAGACVVRDVAPGTTVAGVPARAL